MTLKGWGAVQEERYLKAKPQDQLLALYALVLSLCKDWDSVPWAVCAVTSIKHCNRRYAGG